jgi:four helix bundle protein
VISSYRDLDVWRIAMDLAEASHRLTRAFPKDELFALGSQLRRSAYSVPSNIAEGYGREHTAEYLRFLRIAQGSLKELETQILLAARFGYSSEPEVAVALDLADRVGRMLRALIRTLEGAK